jgi:hypothetical protein
LFLQKWLSILETYNLKQIVNEPTGVTKDSKTLVDYIYITNLEKLQESHVVTIGACLFSISLNKLYQIFKASLGSSTYSTFLNGAIQKFSMPEK